MKIGDEILFTVDGETRTGVIVWKSNTDIWVRGENGVTVKISI